MSPPLTAENQANCIVVKVPTRLDSSNAASFHDELKNTISSRPGQNLVLNCGGLGYISSEGLKTMVQVRKAIVDEGQQIALAGCNEGIDDNLDITGFGTQFTRFATLDEALAALGRT